MKCRQDAGRHEGGRQEGSNGYKDRQVVLGPSGCIFKREVSFKLFLFITSYDIWDKLW